MEVFSTLCCIQLPLSYPCYCADIPLKFIPGIVLLIKVDSESVYVTRVEVSLEFLSENGSKAFG